MRLSDLQSREIVSKSFQAIGGEDTQFSIERYLPNGLYVLSARIGAREMKRKVIIQNDWKTHKIFIFSGDITRIYRLVSVNNRTMKALIRRL